MGWWQWSALLFTSAFVIMVYLIMLAMFLVLMATSYAEVMEEDMKEVLCAGCWVLGAALGAGRWVLGAGCWVLGAGCCVVRWVLCAVWCWVLVSLCRVCL